jgi:hypothetical protein
MKCDALASILKAHALWLSANGMLDRAEAIANLGDALRAHTSAHYGKVLDGAESRLRAGSAVPSADFALSVGQTEPIGLRGGDSCCAEQAFGEAGAHRPRSGTKISGSVDLCQHRA